MVCEMVFIFLQLVDGLSVKVEEEKMKGVGGKEREGWKEFFLSFFFFWKDGS